MNRTDRLLAILIELQRRQTVTAQSLAEKFETSIRTIYRDMDALNESECSYLFNARPLFINGWFSSTFNLRLKRLLLFY